MIRSGMKENVRGFLILEAILSPILKKDLKLKPLSGNFFFLIFICPILTRDR